MSRFKSVLIKASTIRRLVLARPLRCFVEGWFLWLVVPNPAFKMDFQHRAGGKTGSGGVASASESNRDRRERLRQLALETIDINKDPYFMKNHLGSYECKLCLTLHNNEVRVTLCILAVFVHVCLQLLSVNNFPLLYFHGRAAILHTHKARSIRPICEYIIVYYYCSLL